MSDEPLSTPAESAPAPEAPAIVDKNPISMSDAVELLRKRPEAAEAPKDSPEKAEESAPVEKPTSDNEDEDQEQDDPEPKVPPVEPPRSWTKAEKEAFKSLSPEHQQILADRERARDVEIRRGQNEVSEKQKAADEQRNQYENALPLLLDRLSAQHGADFADVKNWADVRQMAQQDPIRYNVWQAQQQEIQGLKQEADVAQQRRSEESQKQFVDFAKEQDALFVKKHPELADPEKMEKAGKETVSYLQDIGLTADELRSLWNGYSPITIRDHRVQSIIRDGAKWRAAEAARKAATPRTVPPVQRPGTPSGNPSTEKHQQLSAQLTKTGSSRDAVALLAAMMRK